MVLREFTSGYRRMDNLEAMGLVRVEYAGIEESGEAVKEFAERLSIAPAQAADALSLMVDSWRKSRKLYDNQYGIYSHYHKKDDPYIQAGLLPLKEFKPEGILLEQDKSNKWGHALLSPTGRTHVQQLIKSWAHVRLTAEQIDDSIRALWEMLAREEKVIVKVLLQSQTGKPLRDVWQVNAESVRIRRHNHKERCTACQRVAARKAPGGGCPRYNCKGTTVSEQPDIENYDVWLMGKPFTMVSAEEHTAQVPGEERNRIENEFKSERGATNCLVATPTLELGVNIGALDMALMRNVPPRPSNYWQRAGRAGREARMAVGPP